MYLLAAETFLAVIVNMVVKPVGNAGWFWGLLAVMAPGVVAVLVTYRRGEEHIAAPTTS